MPKMTPNILRNLFSRPATRPYPASRREPFPAARGELVNNIESCIFCSICAKKCPSQCISVDKNKGIWECDPFACVYCGICVEACPTSCLSQKTTYKPTATQKQTIRLQGTPPRKKG